MITYPRIVFTCVLLVGLMNNVALAQPQSSLGDYPRWSVQALIGSARLHSWDERTGWVQFRVGRTIGSPITSVDVGMGGSGSRAPFTSLTTGLEIRPLPQALVSPFIRGEVGVLGESDFVGVVAGAGGGGVIRLGSRFGLRTGASLNFHGGEKGPITFYGGLEYRW